MTIRTLILSIVLLSSACTLQKPSGPGPGPEPAGGETLVTSSDVAAVFTRQPPELVASAQPVTGIAFTELERQIPADLWTVLRTQFSLPEVDNRRVKVQRNWYVRNPDYMKRVVDRASRYLWHIRHELAKRDMPGEIALLPIVESAFDPFAYSHGRAAGLWQFIPSTGKAYGLEQNWWFDGRRDVLESTRAALDYLQRLQRSFDGDWLLALAAYNSGQGTVHSAMRKNRKKGKPTGFWDLQLPRETRDYVPRLIALKQIVESPERYSVKLDPLPDEAGFEVVETGGQIDLAVAAQLANLPLDTLYLYNPGYNQWATPPDGPHRLLIPVGHVERFRDGIKSLPVEKRLKWVRHKIRSGETLTHIARRYHTTTSALLAANELNGNTIRAGKHLMVPVASQGQEDYSLSATQRRDRLQKRPRGGNKTYHQVSSGDTLWELSRSYKVKLRSLAAWNSMAPGDPLKVGQKLVVWQQKTGANSHPGARVRPVYYKVRKGDSLSRISARFQVTVTDLRRWNKLPEKGYIKPGQNLKLYVDVTRQSGST